MPSGPFYDEGVHVAEIVSHGLTKARTGNTQLVIRVKILGIPEGDTYIPHHFQYERSIFWTITEKTVPFVVEKLQTLQYQGAQVSQLDPSHPQHISLIGQQVDVWCRHEAGLDGGSREKWDVSKAGGIARPLEQLSAKETRELDALFGKALSASKPVARAAAAKVTTMEEELGITDDDVPF